MNVLLMCCMACPCSPAPLKQSKNSITTVSKSEDLLQPEHEKKLHNLYQVQQQLEKLSVHLYMYNLIIGILINSIANTATLKNKRWLDGDFHCNCYFHFASQPANKVGLLSYNNNNCSSVGLQCPAFEQ